MGEVDEQKLRDKITQILDNKRNEAKVKKRSLSNHIGTRWYRAPEVCLLEKYDFASDIWSLGCTIAELTRAVSFKRGFPTMQIQFSLLPLFPGDSCQPISPGQPTDQSSKLSKADMIQLILQSQPSINNQDKAFINNDDTREYLELVQKRIDPAMRQSIVD